MEKKLYGNGIDDDTLAIQALLDGAERTVKLPKPEKFYLISNTLRLGNNKTLILEKDTVIRLADHSDCLMLTNKLDGNENISLIGGIWDMNNRNQRPNPVVREVEEDCLDIFVGCKDYDELVFGKEAFTARRYDDRRYMGFCMAFGDIRGLVLKNLTFKDPVTYGCWFGTIDGFEISDILFDYNDGNPYPVNMDGLHFDGACCNGSVRNLFGTCYDDMVAFTADEFVKGDIENVTVENIVTKNCHSAVRFLAVDHKINNVTVRNIQGTFYQYCIGFTKYYSMGNGVYGRFENILVENCDISKAPMLKKYKKDPVRRYPLMYFQQETRSRNVILKNIRRHETDCAVPLIGIEDGADTCGLKTENVKQTSEVGSLKVMGNAWD